MKKMMPIFIAGLATVFLTLHVSAQQSPATQNDTLCVTSAGTNNHVIINSKNVTQLNDCIDSLAVKGEIVQNGQNNKVAIQTPNNNRQTTNKHQKANSKNQTTGNKKPVTSNQQHVTISQSGKNNSVKINSR